MRKLLYKICDEIFVTVFNLKLKTPYFLCSRGIGDTIIFLSRLDGYYKKTNNKVSLIIQQNQIVLLDPYKDYIERFIALPTNMIDSLIQITWKKKKKNIFFILPSKASDKLKMGSNLFDLVGNTLGIHGNEYLSPHFNVSAERIAKIKENLGINKKKYVIIAPNSVSVIPISEYIWREIVTRCKENGYVILENVQFQDEIRFGDINVFLPLDEMYEIAKDADHIYSTRSGLSDLLAFSGAPMTVFYPNKEAKELFSFNNMPFSKHVEEIIVQ